MSLSKPLSYPSQRAVLRHINEGRRFEVQRTIPSLRRLEKELPLQLDKLELAPFSITSNDLTYTINAIKCPTIPYDVDITCLSQEQQEKLQEDIMDMSPGDVRISSKFHERTVVGSQHITYSRHYLSSMEQKENVDEDFLDSLRTTLLPYELIPIPLTRENWIYRIQLTVKCADRVHREMVEYTKGFHVAMKYLMAKFFMGRKTMLRVAHFIISPRYDDCCFRLPEGWKIIIGTLRIMKSAAEVISEFESVIDDRSFPLKKFESDLMGYYESRGHPKVVSAQKVIIVGGFISKRGFSRFDHRRMHFDHVYTMNFPHFLRVKNHFVYSFHTAGTHYSYNVENQRTVEGLLKYLRKCGNTRVQVFDEKLGRLGKYIVIHCDDKYGEVHIFGKAGVLEKKRYVKFPTINFKFVLGLSY